MRSKTADYSRPYIISTSERVPQFFHLGLGHAMSDIALRLEAYCLSGTRGKRAFLPSIGALCPNIIVGVVDNYVARLLQLKSNTSGLILDQLREHMQTLIFTWGVGTAAHDNFQVLLLGHRSHGCTTLILMKESPLSFVLCAKDGLSQNSALPLTFAHAMKSNSSTMLGSRAQQLSAG